MWRGGGEEAAGESYLEVNKIEPPRGRVLVGAVHHQQGVLEAADRLAVEGVLHRGVDAAAPGERRSLGVGLQLHRVQGGPVPSGHGVEPLTHGKAGDEQSADQCSNSVLELLWFFCCCEHGGPGHFPEFFICERKTSKLSKGTNTPGTPSKTHLLSINQSNFICIAHIHKPQFVS